MRSHPPTCPRPGSHGVQTPSWPSTMRSRCCAWPGYGRPAAGPPVSAVGGLAACAWHTCSSRRVACAADLTGMQQGSLRRCETHVQHPSNPLAGRLHPYTAHACRAVPVHTVTCDTPHIQAQHRRRRCTRRSARPAASSPFAASWTGCSGEGCMQARSPSSVSGVLWF